MKTIHIARAISFHLSEVLLLGVESQIRRVLSMMAHAQLAEPSDELALMLSTLRHHLRVMTVKSLIVDFCGS